MSDEKYKIKLKNINQDIIDYAIVSEIDYENIIKYKWYLDNNFYARSKINGKSISMHKYILNNNDRTKVIDHIDNNKLNNKRDNLRIVSLSDNARNRTKQNNVTSIYYGVSYAKKNNLWMVSILLNDKILQAYYKNELHAAYHNDYLILKYKISCGKLNNIEKPNNFKLYIPKSKNTDLPVNINLSNNKYRLKINNKYIKFDKLFNTLEEAINKKEEILKIKKINKNIIKNDKNETIIELFNKQKECIGSTIVDEDLYIELLKYKWTIVNKKYIHGRVNKKYVRLHRFVLNYYGNDLVDHINGNTFDNRRNNLRIVTENQNAMNKSKRKGKSSSQYLGVYFDKKLNKWCALIKINKKNIHLGKFDNEIDAAKTRDIATKQYFKEYGKLNFN